MENLIFSLNATIPIFLTMVIGYVLRQMNFLDDSFVNTLNSFNFKITLPFLIFRDIASADFYEVWDTKYVLFCFLATLVCILVLSVAGYFLCRKQQKLLGEFIQASYRSSAAVLGIAFIQNIYGTSGMAPLMIIGTVPLYNVATVIILSLTAPGQSGLNRSTIVKTLKGIVTNPIIIGIVLGMVSSLLRISYPPIISKTISNIAVLATPLALIGLGAGFEGRKALRMIAPTLICTFNKLILQAAIFLPLAVMLGFRSEKLIAILVMLGSPTTVSCYIMAKNMEHDGVLTSSAVVSTTFLSAITLTFWLYLLKSMQLI
ncbi:MAG: AEC family transporter [Lachnospiraceae bacterium]|nr:AEC family transporter [Lachnospiraceae bacterium]